MCHTKHSLGGARPVSRGFVRRKREHARSCHSCHLAIFQNGAAGYSCVCVSAAICFFFFFFPGAVVGFSCVRLRRNPDVFSLPAGWARAPWGRLGQRGKPPSPNVGRRLGCLWRGRHSGRQLLADKRLEMLLERHTEVATQLRQFNCYSEALGGASWYITIYIKKKKSKTALK